MDHSQQRRADHPKRSIFKGPKNSNFFKHSQESSIEEGRLGEESKEHEEEVEGENKSQDNIQIKIYEGKKLAPYQDPRRL